MKRENEEVSRKEEQYCWTMIRHQKKQERWKKEAGGLVGWGEGRVFLTKPYRDYIGSY